MIMQSKIHHEIISHLKKDEKLVQIIENVELKIHKEPMSVFEDLVRSIVSQQLSTTAASTIYGRFLTGVGSYGGPREGILKMPTAEMRSCGLSFQKADYIKNVAVFFDDNNLHDTDWESKSDEDIIHQLTQIKGVGKWTVEMILMFSLFRPDVLPLDDLIIRTRMVQLYNVTSEKKQLMADLTEIAEKWRPYRTYACRYLWGSKDLKVKSGK